MDRDSPQIVTVFGGSGFVGTQLTQALARKGWRVRVAVRRPDLAGHVRPLGDVGQVVPIQADVRNPDSVRRAVNGATAVINLVAVGFQRGAQRFATVNVGGAETVAEAARAAGAATLTHMSILGADPTSPSDFARSRAQAEEAVLAAFPKAVIARPSLIFGPGDGFFNLMASMARLLPIMPLIGAKTRFQPVYVGDVADALALAAEGAVTGGLAYELGGPEVVSHKELLEIILRETQRNNLLLPLPEGIARLVALPTLLLPTPLITPDQVRLLQVDNVVSPAATREGRTLAAFGIAPTPMEAILPTYLWRFRRHGQFDRIAA
jgi:uncharacterized protein YbjT (DUF2867 family)